MKSMPAQTLVALTLVALAAACGDDALPDAAIDAPAMDAPPSDASPPIDATPSDSGEGDAADVMDGGPSDAETDAGSIDASTGSCADGARNGSETGIDCGGACPSCANGRGCADNADCASARCVDEACVSPEGTHPDIIRVAEVSGRDPGGRSWADSYSVGDQCYCESTFDHDIGPIEVETPVGVRTVREVCDAIGPGPGSEPAGEDPRPLYNDIQCGNGPANDAGDEDDCPGRVDIGREGCGQIGPRWDLSVLE